MKKLKLIFLLSLIVLIFSPHVLGGDSSNKTEKFIVTKEHVEFLKSFMPQKYLEELCNEELYDPEWEKEYEEYMNSLYKSDPNYDWEEACKDFYSFIENEKSPERPKLFLLKDFEPLRVGYVPIYYNSVFEFAHLSYDEIGMKLQKEADENGNKVDFLIFDEEIGIRSFMAPIQRKVSDGIITINGTAKYQRDPQTFGGLPMYQSYFHFLEDILNVLDQKIVIYGEERYVEEITVIRGGASDGYSQHNYRVIYFKTDSGIFVRVYGQDYTYFLEENMHKWEDGYVDTIYPVSSARFDFTLEEFQKYGSAFYKFHLSARMGLYGKNGQYITFKEYLDKYYEEDVYFETGKNIIYEADERYFKKDKEEKEYSDIFVTEEMAERAKIMMDQGYLSDIYNTEYHDEWKTNHALGYPDDYVFFELKRKESALLPVFSDSAYVYSHLSFDEVKEKLIENSNNFWWRSVNFFPLNKNEYIPKKLSPIIRQVDWYGKRIFTYCDNSSSDHIRMEKRAMERSDPAFYYMQDVLDALDGTFLIYGRERYVEDIIIINETLCFYTYAVVYFKTDSGTFVKTYDQDSTFGPTEGILYPAEIIMRLEERKPYHRAEYMYVYEFTLDEFQNYGSFYYNYYIEQRKTKANELGRVPHESFYDVINKMYTPEGSVIEKIRNGELDLWGEPDVSPEVIPDVIEDKYSPPLWFLTFSALLMLYIVLSFIQLGIKKIE